MKSLMKYEPLGLPSLFDTISMDLFDEFFTGFPHIWHSKSLADNYWSPRTDLIEMDDSYKLRMDMPGLDKKDIDIEVRDNYLTVTGKKNGEVKREFGDYIVSERTAVGFHRHLGLPEDVSKDEIEATYNEGVLELTLRKDKKLETKRKIPLK